MLVKINEEMALNMLVERVKFWSDEDNVIELYSKMYEYYIESGCFEGMEFDINQIVDNDYVNNTAVVSEGDEGYEDIKKLYNLYGLGDISCEHEFNHGYSYIEAEYNGNFLIRY